MEHLVIILNGRFQKVATIGIKGRGILRVFLVDDAVRLFLVGTIAKNRSNTQSLGGVRYHLLFKLLVIELGHGHGAHGKDGVKAAQTLLALDFLHLLPTSRGHVPDIGQGVKDIGFVAAISFAVKIIKDILGHKADARRRHHHLFPINAPHHFVRNILFHFHGFDKIHPEGQHVFIVNGVHDGIGVQLVAKGLLRGHKLRIAATAGIDGKNRRTGEAKEVILFEALDDIRMHFAKLGAMAFVKNNHSLLLVNRMLGVFLDEGGQLLNGGDDDMSIVILQLLLELGGAGIAIGSALFKAVIFLHGLVIQILAVYYKKHLVDKG